LALVFALALPASADHVYSHRVVIEGRVVGADGLPIAGRDVNVTFEGDVLGEPCSMHQNVTDASGDFWFCYHKHGVLPNTTVQVRTGNVTDVRPVDRDLRHMTFLLRDEDATGVAPPAWNGSFLVAGRVWRSGLVDLEGVDVSGIVLAHELVTVTLVSDVGNETRQAFTDKYGDYWVNLTARPDAMVLVQGAGQVVPVRLDPVFHRSAVDLLTSPAPIPRAAPEIAALPGTTNPRVPVGLVLGVVVALTAAVAWTLRKRG
jgi:hypothetical protein